MYFRQNTISSIFKKVKRLEKKPEVIEFESKGSDEKEKLIVRLAKPKDLKEVMKLNLELFKNQQKNFDATLNLYWTFSKEGKKYFRKRISEVNTFIEVIENPQKKILIAYAIGFIQKRHNYRAAGKYMELESIFVETKYSGSKLGSKLLNDFIGWGKANKVDNVSLFVAAKNNLARDFYKKFGFEDYDIVMELNLKKNS
jgi:ribosomal protein S18 acetylase RimI-like enzyme